MPSARAVFLLLAILTAVVAPKGGRRRRAAGRRRCLGIGSSCSEDGQSCAMGLECVCEGSEGGRRLFGAPPQAEHACTCLATPDTATAVSASVSAAATAASHRAATLDAACHLPRLCVKLYVVIGYTPTYREESCHSAQAHSCYVRRRVELEDERSHSQSHAMGMAITKLRPGVSMQTKMTFCRCGPRLRSAARVF